MTSEIPPFRIEVVLPVQELLVQLEAMIANKFNEYQKQSIEEKLLTVKEVCKLFQVSRGTICNWKKAGKLKKAGPGLKDLFKYTEVMEAANTLKKYKR